MLALFITVVISAGGSVLAWVFRETLLSAIFSRPSPAQQAVDTQRKMDENIINEPSDAQAIQDLDDGKV